MTFHTLWIHFETSCTLAFEQSTDILGWEYLNNSNFQYGGADTWYPSWSNDNNLYSPWTDGSIISNNNGVNVTIHSGSGSSGTNWDSTTGYVTIIGDNPQSLQITNGGTFTSSTYPYRGRYPCGSLYYNNTWFYGTYLLNATDNNNDGCGNWCEQGILNYIYILYIIIIIIIIIYIYYLK